VAIVGVLKPDEVILHSRQGWSTISIGVIPVDFEGQPRLRLPLTNRRVGYWPSCILPHGYSHGIAFFAQPHVLQRVCMRRGMSWPEAGGAGVMAPSVTAHRLVLDGQIGGQGCQRLRVITVVVDGENPRPEQVVFAGAMIKRHSPCLCFLLQLQGDMTDAIPLSIARAANCGAELWLCSGSAALVVSPAVAGKPDKKHRVVSPAVADKPGKKHPDLMEIDHKAKDWTCKRGEVEAIVVHYDFKGNPRGAGRERRR